MFLCGGAVSLDWNVIDLVLLSFTGAVFVCVCLCVVCVCVCVCVCLCTCVCVGGGLVFYWGLWMSAPE